uniref:OTU domain-containing protein n=2 Tax=Caenorhabditis tropicalis TaxID=1561998 RepID=A0A1I7TPH5_9PELO
MGSDDEQQNDENPMISRHRKEKKELRAKILGLKKSAKSGNKQKQKETNQECEKLEKELEERHRQELLQAAQPSSEATPLSTEAPEEPKEPVEPSGEAGGSEDQTEEEPATSSSKFYKNFKISGKNAKKQAKKKEQEEKMKAAVAADKEAARRTDTEKHAEKAAIKAMLTEDRLKMCEIPADGDCMYNAIVHQLQEENIEISVRKLRKHCAAFMREHPDDFRGFIADTDVGEVGADTTHHWETYLQGVERCAEVGGVWGGELELKAVSMMYEKTIVRTGPSTLH